MKKPKNIPLMRPRLPHAQSLLPYLKRIDDNAHYTNFGPLECEFRERIAAFHEQRWGRQVHVVTTTSATSALELALSALRLAPGSRVLLPALTFIGTAAAVVRCGLIPVVADVDDTSWLMTPQTLPQSWANDRISAVVPVAAYGMPQDIDAWAQWQAQTGVPVIMDAAGAFGAQKSAPGITVIFSLHATKSLSSGEGGLLVTEDAALAERYRKMTNFGIGLDEPDTGTNAKMSEYHAAVGLAGLDLWQEQARQRLALRAHYQKVLTDYMGDEIRFQQPIQGRSDLAMAAPCLMPIRFTTEGLRRDVERRCAAQGIQTRPWYLPLIHQQPTLDKVERCGTTHCADALSTTLLGLPFYLGLSADQVQRVAQVVSDSRVSVLG